MTTPNKARRRRSQGRIVTYTEPQRQAIKDALAAAGVDAGDKMIHELESLGMWSAWQSFPPDRPARPVEQRGADEYLLDFALYLHAKEKGFMTKEEEESIAKEHNVCAIVGNNVRAIGPAEFERARANPKLPYGRIEEMIGLALRCAQHYAPAGASLASVLLEFIRRQREERRRGGGD
jgi:hypothetical protein